MQAAILALGVSVTNLRDSASDLWSDGRGWILVAVGVGWFLSRGVRVVFPALVPYFLIEFGINLSTAGLLLTMLWGAYAIGQFPGGILGDRFGEGNILIFSTAISTIGVATVLFSRDIVHLFVGVILFGVATALYGPIRFTIFTEIYPKRSGTAVGITMAAGNVGNAILPAIAGIAALYATWRLSFGLFIPMFVGATIAIWLAVPGRTSSGESAVDSLSIATVRDIVGGIRNRSILIVVGIQVLLNFVGRGFVGFFPVYLTDVHDLEPGVAATIFALYFGCAIVVQPLAGISSDRFGTKWTLIAVLVLFLLGLIALPFVVGLLPIVLVTAVLSSRSGSGVVNNTFIADTLPDNMKGTGLGVLRSGWMLLGATSPFFVGFVGDLGKLEEAFFVLAGLVGVALLLSVYVFDDRETLGEEGSGG